MRTIQMASISLLALMATGTLTPAAGQPSGAGQRPPSVELPRRPATPKAVSRAVERAVHPPTGAIRLGSISDAATEPVTRPGTTASTATPTRPATMPKGILKTQNPRWSMEAVNGQKRVHISPEAPDVKKIPNQARQTLADPTSHAQFKAGHSTHTGRLVNPKPTASTGSTPTAARPVTMPRTTASTATVARPVRALRVDANGRTILGSVSEGPAPAQARSAIVRHPQPASLARTGAGTVSGTAARAAAISGSKAVAQGAVGGVVVYGAVEVIAQEFASPGKTITDLKNGKITPKWNEVGASAVGGAATAAAVAAGAAALPAMAVGAAAYGAVMITDQEIKDPGKTARDIEAMTGGAVDLKQAGADVNKGVDAGAREVKKAAAKTATDIHKAAKGVLGAFGIK